MTTQQNHKRISFPKSVPESVKEYVRQQQEIYLRSKNVNDNRQSRAWLLAKRLFLNAGMDDEGIWEWLEGKSSEAPLAFAEEVVEILHSHELLRTGYRDIIRRKALVEKSMASLSKLQTDLQEITARNNNDPIFTCRDALIKELGKWRAGFEEQENTICKSDRVFGLGREAYTRRGQSAFFAVMLAIYMRKNFGLPKNDKVATATNAIFKTEYTDNNVASLSKLWKR